MPIQYLTTEDFHIERYTRHSPTGTTHYHHAFELYYVLEGERDFFIGDKFFSAKQGDLVWVPGNILHRTAGKSATHILLYFKSSYLYQILSERLADQLTRHEPFVFTPDAQEREEFENLLFNLLREYNKSKIPDESPNELLIAKLLFEILYFIHSRDNYYNRDTSKPNERMNLIIKYINENYNTPLSIQDVADRFGITRDHLCHVFPQHVGVTFVTYLNVIRIKAACDMLREQKDTVSNIAVQCGFSSSHYFCKVFKQEKGISPSEYRAQLKRRIPVRKSKKNP